VLIDAETGEKLIESVEARRVGGDKELLG